MTAPVWIEALPFWKSPPVLTPLDGGRTNRNYLAEDGCRRYFVRSGQDIPHLGISRAAERRSAALAAEAGLAPRIRHAAEGVFITDFIDGTTLDPVSACAPPMLARIARHLGALHRIPPAADLPLFCPATIAQAYLDRLDDADLPLPRAKLRRCLADLPRAATRCLVHGDLIPENFILSTEGALLLIDWEYAGNGQPEIDLALVAGNFDLSEAQLGDFIAAYGDVDHAAIAGFTTAAIIREALWCRIQLRHGEASADLPDYSRKCAARAARRLA